MKTKRRYFGRERAYCILKYRAKKHSSITSQFWNIFFLKVPFYREIKKTSSFYSHLAGKRVAMTRNVLNKKGIPLAGRSMGYPIMITQSVRISTVYINYIVAALTISKNQAVRITISYFSYISTTILVISNALSCY